MYYHQPLLLAPGPTPVPDAIMREIQVPMVGHRSKDFEDIAQQAFQGLKPIFGGQSDVLILTSSGTSVLEASMLNIINPEDHSAVTVPGVFGNRFKQITQTYYKNVYIYDVTWGEAVDVKDLINHLSTLDVGVKAVFSQYCKTSTTVLHPIHELGNVINQLNSSIYFIVDSVSCISTINAGINKDKIDVLVSGSQKATMLPPGLALVAYSHRIKKRFKEVTTPKFHLDLNKYISPQADSFTLFIPNVSLFRGVNAYAKTVEAEGFNHVIVRHYVVRNALRSTLKALDLTSLVNNKDASLMVTAFKPNTNGEVKIIKDKLKNCSKTTIAGDQGHLKGQILRIGHMGKISSLDTLSVVSTLEIILTEHRKVNYIGEGISKYMEVIHEAI